MSKLARSLGRSPSSKLAASFVSFDDDSRPLTPEEFDFARLFVRHWRVARNVVVKVFGKGAADAPPDFQISKGWDQTYAMVRSKEYDPNTMGRAVWSKLDHSDQDLIYLIEALLASGDLVTALDGATMVLDGRRFTVAYYQDTPHLIVEDAREIAAAN